MQKPYNGTHILYLVHVFLVIMIKNKFLFNHFQFSHCLYWLNSGRENSKIQFNLRVESFTFRINIHNLKKLHLCGYSNETLFLRYKIKFDTLLFYFGLFRMNTVIFENHVGEKRITYSGSSWKQTPSEMGM